MGLFDQSRQTERKQNHSNSGAIKPTHNSWPENYRPAAHTQRRGCCSHPVSKVGTPRTVLLGSLLLCFASLVCFLLSDLCRMSRQVPLLQLR